MGLVFSPRVSAETKHIGNDKFPRYALCFTAAFWNNFFRKSVLAESSYAGPNMVGVNYFPTKLDEREKFYWRDN